MSNGKKDPRTGELLDLFEAAKSDEARRNRLLRSPLEALAELGIEVDPVHREAVAQGLRAAAIAVGPSEGEAAGPRPKRVGATATDFERYFHFSVEPWGLVLRMDHEAVRELPKGIDAIGTLAGAAFGVIKAAGSIGPTAVVVAMGLAFWGAVFTAYVVVIPEIDRGKGVYLTITWPQIVLFGASGGLIGPALMPIPTAVV